MDGIYGTMHTSKWPQQYLYSHPATCFYSMWPRYCLSRGDIYLFTPWIWVCVTPRKIWFCVSSRNRPSLAWKLLLQPLGTQPLCWEMSKPHGKTSCRQPRLHTAELPVHSSCQLPAMWVSPIGGPSPPELQLSVNSTWSRGSTQLCPVSSQNHEPKKMTAVLSH